MVIKVKTCILWVADAAVPTHATLLAPPHSTVQFIAHLCLSFPKDFLWPSKPWLSQAEAAKKLFGKLTLSEEWSSTNDKSWQIVTSAIPTLVWDTWLPDSLFPRILRGPQFDNVWWFDKEPFVVYLTALSQLVLPQWCFLHLPSKLGVLKHLSQGPLPREPKLRLYANQINSSAYMYLGWGSREWTLRKDPVRPIDFWLVLSMF